MTDDRLRSPKLRRFGSVMGIAVLIPALSLIVAAFVYAGWQFLYPSYSWHQKLTIEIDTPQGIVKGSAVSKVTWGDSPNILPDPPHVYHHFVGEAVVVELPQIDGQVDADKKYLFALTRNTDFEALHAFAPHVLPRRKPYFTNSLLLAAQEVTRHFGEMREMSPDEYPLLVTFGDIGDPTSVQIVDPRRLSESLGSGNTLISINLLITDLPVTEGKVMAVIGWLEALGRKQANLIGKPKIGRVSEQPDPTIYLITPSDFSAELYK